MMANINVDTKAGGAVGQSADAVDPVNPKEKTPMCLINELSRFNKLKHQYTLVDEQGPAHKKTFFVQLKLGDEEYNATEGSIKRAQHLAAQQAITVTKYPHPPPKDPKELLGPYDVEADKIIRLKPAPVPNPPGFKKQQKSIQGQQRTPPPPRPPPAAPRDPRIQQRGPVGAKTNFGGGKTNFGGGKTNFGGGKPLGDGIVQVARPIKNFAQKSVEKARNYMQNRNQNQNYSFGSSHAFDGSPAMKRPRVELPPPTAPISSFGGLSSVRHNNELLQLKRERVEQEWERIGLERKHLEIDQQRLEMQRDKYQYEIRLLEYQLLEYDRSMGTTTTGASARRMNSTPLSANVIDSAPLAGSSRLYEGYEYQPSSGYNAF